MWEELSKSWLLLKSLVHMYVRTSPNLVTTLPKGLDGLNCNFQGIFLYVLSCASNYKF